MGINNTQTAYSFGQMGSMYINDTDSCKPPTGKVIVGITVVEDCKFTSLVADSDTSNGLEYVGTTAAHDAGAATATSGQNGEEIANTEVFQAGLSIYGRWTTVQLAEGKIIAYIGD